MKKRFLSLLLVLAMCAAVLPTVALAGDAVSYIDFDADGKQKTDPGSCTDYMVVDSSSSDSTWENGWYVASHTAEISGKVRVSGAVNLIVCDGAELSVNGIEFSGAASLTIYAQSGGTGKLTVNGYEDGSCYGIKVGGGTLTVNGGTVHAIGKTNGDNYKYGSYYGIYLNRGRLVINGGSVTAEGGDVGTSYGLYEYYNGTVSVNGGSLEILNGVVMHALIVTGGSVSGNLPGYKVEFYDGDTLYLTEYVDNDGFSRALEPEEPEKDGCAFMGWFKDEGCTEKYDFNKTVEGSFSLYAKWEEVEDEPEIPSFVWLIPGGLAGATDLTNPTFADVSRGAYYYNAVEWAANHGIAGGVDSKHFAPDESCTRAQAVTMMWRAAGCPDIYGANPFVDVDSDDYYYDAVLWAVAMGITSGTDENHFSPDEPCTRGQIVTFLHRAARCYQAHENYGFVDVKTGSYCEDAVNWAVEIGITNGTSEATFSPDGVCTRAQIVTFLYRNR